ncbi:MAG: hypothetical protein HYU36_05280 [Planctomycetes bacterium]|nr:hypothetical protein [Planctomycetota bacterium]
MKVQRTFIGMAIGLGTFASLVAEQPFGRDREIQMLREEVQKLREELARQNGEIERLKAGQRGMQAAPVAPSASAGMSQDRQDTKALLSELLQELHMESSKQTEEENALVTSYDDGFVFKGKDDVLKIGGWLQTDFRQIESDHPGDSGFLVRNARLDVRGTLENDFSYRLFGDFSGAGAKLVEGWLEYHHYAPARLRVGQMVEPFSLEALTSFRWVDLIERSMVVTAFSPQEDLGAMLFGTMAGKRIEYALGVFNGRGKNVEDNNDDKDVAARAVLSPFAGSNSPWMRGLYVGTGMTWGEQEEDFSGTSFRTAARTPFFQYARGASFRGDRTRVGADVEWFMGPASLKAEWLNTRFENVSLAGTSLDAGFSGWYVTATYLLTGEKKPRNKPVVPKKNFDPRLGGWGAWELVGRFERFDADNELIPRGLASGSDEVDAYTLGLHWWPNPHIKISFNYVHTLFDDDVAVSGSTLDDEDAFLFRFQYNF